MLKFPPFTNLTPVNACIYCDTQEAPLSDEHIIPYSLGGRYILPKASCPTCAKATSQLELYAGRQIFQDVRIEHGFPTRRPKDRPTELPLHESFDPTPEEAPIRLVPAKDYPGLLIISAHEPAGFLLGKPPGSGALSEAIVRFITAQDRVDRLKERGIPAKIYRDFQPDLFLRLLAKVALGFAVATDGLSGFEPTVREVILRRDTDPYHWVDGTRPEMTQLPLPSSGMLHRAITYPREIRCEVFLLVELQLFGYLDTPIYTVVVGKKSRPVATTPASP